MRGLEANGRRAGARRPRGRGANGETDEIEHLDFSVGAANDAERARLRLRGKEDVYRIHRVRSCNGRPFSVERMILPVRLFPGLTNRAASRGNIVALARGCGLRLGKARERALIGRASALAAETFSLTHSAPVFVLDRMVTTVEGCPVEWRIAECRLAPEHLEIISHASATFS